MTLDGGGDAYIADNFGNIYEFAMQPYYHFLGSIETTRRTLGSDWITPNGVAVDGSGNVYVANSGGGTVKEILATNGSIPASPTIRTLGSGFVNPMSVAVDGTGNVFVGDLGLGAVVEMLAVNRSIPASPTIRTLAASVAAPSALALDGMGNLHTTDVVSNEVGEIPASGGYATVTTLASGFKGPRGVAVDGAGNVYFSAPYNHAVEKLDFADAPGLSFAATDVGVVSSAQTVRVTNGGNATLTFSSVSYPTGFPEASSAASECTSTTSLAPGATCMVTVAFSPTAVGSPSDAVMLTDNALNGAATQQSIAMSGTAIQGSQTISFTVASPVTYGVSPITLVAIGGASGNPVTFSLVSGPGTLSGLNNGTLSITGAGTVTVTANQAGDSNYAAATQATQNIMVGLATAIVNVTPYNVTYDGYPHAAAGTATGVAAANLSADLNLSGTTQTNAGNYASDVWTFHDAGGNCADASGGLSDVIQSAAPVLPPPGTGSGTYGTSETLSVTISATSGEIPTGTIQFQFVSGGVTYNICADGTLQVQPVATPCGVTLSGTGTAAVTTTSLPANVAADTVTATYLPGDSNYVGGTTTINYSVTQASTQANLTISPAIAPAYGDAVTLSSVVSDSRTGSTGTPTGTVQFEYSVDGGANWNLLGAAVVLVENPDGTVSAQTATTTLPAGTPGIKAVYSGDSNFTGTTSGTTVYGVNQKTLTVTGIAASDKPYDGTTAAKLNTSSAALAGAIGTEDVSLGGSATGVFADPTAGPGKQVTISGLTLSGAAAANYALTQPTATASISKVPLTITAPSLTVIYGDPAPVLTPVISGFVKGEDATVLTAQPVCAASYTSASNAGSAQTTGCSGAAAVNYSFSYVGGTVTVNKATAGIVITPYNVTYDCNPHTAAGTATGLDSANLSADLNLSGSTHTNAGIYASDAWTFHDAGGNYADASGSASDLISKATPTVKWHMPAAMTYGTALSATQLNASSVTPGIFTYSPTSGTVPAAGTQTLSVTLAPTDSIDYANATTTVSLTVNQATPSVAVLPASPSITTVQSLQITVAVSGPAGTVTPTGRVALSSGTYGAQQTLLAGATIFTMPAGALLAGIDTLTAAYTPDATGAADYTAASGSAAETVIQPIGTAVATVTVTPSATPITDEMAITVSVPVKGVAGQPTPTGKVTVTSGNYSTQQTLASGAVSFNIPAGSLAAGANTLTASYTGDGTFAPATGTATINVLPFVIEAPSVSPIAHGSTGTGTFTVSAGSTYSGTVDLSCTLTGSPAGAVSLPTCTLNPTTLPLTPGSKGTTVLTVHTTAATSAMAKPAGNGLWGIGGGGLAVAALLMFGIPSRKRRWLSMIVLLFVVAVAGTIGCGGHSTSGGGGGMGTPATTAGVYTFTIVGTDSATATTKSSATVSITVE